ncbi:FAD binding domain-containing protein [Schizophyllum commune]
MTNASTAPIKESHTDVLIIGAGPTGLMAATALKRAGVDVRIVDKKCTYGLADDLLRQGAQIRVSAFYNPSATGDGIELTSRTPSMAAANSDARYPHSVNLHQGLIEENFQRAMRAMGVEVERATVPTSIEISEDEGVLRGPEAYAVKVHLASALVPPHFPHSLIHARFVLGADGARSWTRKALGLVLEGEQTDLYWGVIDFVPETNFPDVRNFCALHTHHGSLMLIPREGDMVRLYVELDKDALDLDEKGDLNREKMSPEGLMQVAKLCLQPFHIDLKHPDAGYHWWTIYRIGQRVANNFAVRNRVFLAGDATHTHSPKAGQGMNAGMGDAHNWAWKIAQVLKGHANMALLTTYELERRQYAQDLIAFDKMYAKMFSGRPPSNANATGVTHDEFYRVYKSSSSFTSGISITYAPSMITRTSHGECASGVIVGARFPPQVFVRAADAMPVNIHDLLPANGRFKVLVFVGDHTRPTFASDARQFAEGLTVLLAKYGGITASDSMDVVTILAGKQDPEHILPLPSTLRPHWSSVLVDSSDANGRSASEEYGIDPSRGAVVIVRPDSHVGAIMPLQHVGGLTDYFDSFLRL